MIDADNVDPMDAREWEKREPIPLTSMVPLPPFPVDRLPKKIGGMVLGVAEATQTDPAMAATSALTALSAGVCGRVEIKIRRGWCEILALQTVTVADSGERKSSVHQQMVKPVYDAEQKRAAAARLTRRGIETRKQVAEKRAEAQRNIAAKAEGEDRAEQVAAAIAAADAAEAIEVPPIPRLTADDVTPEAAGALLADHGRAAVISTEGGIFDTIAGRYSRGISNMDVFLKGHSGDQVKIDRKGQPLQYVPRPAVVMGVMIQPEVLRSIGANRDFRGRGFLARILFARPVSKVGRRGIGPPVDEAVVKEYEKVVFELTRDLFDRTEVAILTLTAAALEAMQRIESDVEPTLVGDGELAQLTDWGSKYAGAVARIAAILHMAEHGSDEGPKRRVEKETIEDAEKIGEYFKAAAINSFVEMGTNGALADAVYLLDKITHLGKEELSERDMQGRQRNSTPKLIFSLHWTFSLNTTGYFRYPFKSQQKVSHHHLDTE